MDSALRPVYHATETDGKSVRVVYSSAAPSKYIGLLTACGLCRICCGGCDCSTYNSRAQTLKDTSIILYENKLEYNNPWTSGCYGGSNVTTVYLDDPRFVQYEKAGCCSPFCTHNSCCPTWWDSCGEGIVIYKRVGWSECCSVKCSCCFDCSCKKCEDPPNYSYLSGSFPTNVAQQAGAVGNKSCCLFCFQDYILLYPVEDSDRLVEMLRHQKQFVQDYISTHQRQKGESLLATTNPAEMNRD
jgi:hypothetical protein